MMISTTTILSLRFTSKRSTLRLNSKTLNSSMCGLYLFALHCRNGLDGAFFRITASYGLDNRPVAYIEYWNLNLDKFEPLLERCSFVVQQYLKQESCENSKLRVLTNPKRTAVPTTTATGSASTSPPPSSTCKEGHGGMAMCKKLDRQNCESDSFVKRFPEQLKNFFGIASITLYFCKAYCMTSKFKEYLKTVEHILR